MGAPMMQAATTAWTELGAAWLLTYALHSTLLVGVAWLAARLLSRLQGGPHRTLATQEALWKTALLGGLVTATLQMGLGWQPPLGSWQLTASGPTALQRSSTSHKEAADRFVVAPGPEERAARSSEAIALPKPTPQPSGLRVPGADPARPMRAAAAASETVDPLGAAPADREPVSSLSTWTAAVTGLWLLGALAFLSALALSYYSFCRRIRNRSRVVGGDLRRLFDRLEPERAVGREVALSASSRLQSPLAKGVRRPEVCLPVRVLSELSGQQQETLLAHELGHLVRRDPAWLLVARTVESLFFFQPLNRLARRRLQEISELRADDWAVSATGNPLDLARCLTRVADWNLTPVPVPSMAAKGSGLTQRVHRLLQSRETEGDRLPRGLWLAAAAVLLLIALAAPGVTAGSGSPEAPPAPPAPEAPPEAPPTPETPPAPEALPSPDAPSALEAPPAPEAVPAPEAPPSPDTAPALAPRPSLRRVPSAEAPATAPLPPAPPVAGRPGSLRVPRAAPTPESPATAPSLSQPPHIGPVPRVPLAPSSLPSPSGFARPPRPERIAWLAGAPPSGEPGERVYRHGESEDLTEEQLEALEAELAEALEQALEPLGWAQEELSSQLAEGLEAQLEALNQQVEAFDSSLEIEMETLDGLLGEDLGDLSAQEIRGLNAEIQALNQALAAELKPHLDLDLQVHIPELEHLAQRSAEQARAIAEEAHRLAGNGLTEEEASRLREQARRLAEEMEPRREEMQRAMEEARQAAVKARERSQGQMREMRQRLREQQELQMEELRRRLETMRQERQQERERQREVLRQRLESQREQLEGQRQELRERLRGHQDQQREELRKRLEAQREELDRNREMLRNRLQREREERRLQMQEHRNELERQRRERDIERERDLERGREGPEAPEPAEEPAEEPDEGPGREPIPT